MKAAQKQFYNRTQAPGTGAAYLDWQAQVFSGTSGGGVNGQLIPSRTPQGTRIPEGRHRKNAKSVGNARSKAPPSGKCN